MVSGGMTSSRTKFDKLSVFVESRPEGLNSWRCNAGYGCGEVTCYVRCCRFKKARGFERELRESGFTRIGYEVLEEQRRLGSEQLGEEQLAPTPKQAMPDVGINQFEPVELLQQRVAEAYSQDSKNTRRYGSKVGQWLDNSKEESRRYEEEEASREHMLGEDVEGTYWSFAEAGVKCVTEKVEKVREPTTVMCPKYYTVMGGGAMNHNTVFSPLSTFGKSVQEENGWHCSMGMGAAPVSCYARCCRFFPDNDALKSDKDALKTTSSWEAQPAFTTKCHSRTLEYKRASFKVVKGYVGCYPKKRNADTSAALEHGHYQDPLMTIQKCVNSCKAGSYLFAGLHNQVHCFCGDDYGEDGREYGCGL